MTKTAHLTRQHRLNHKAGSLQDHHVTHDLASLQDHHITRDQGMGGSRPDPPSLDNGGQAAMVNQRHHLIVLPAEDHNQVSCS